MRSILLAMGVTAFLAGCSTRNEEPFTPVSTVSGSPRTASNQRAGRSNVEYTHPIRYHHNAGDSRVSPGPSSLAELDMAGGDATAALYSSGYTPSGGGGDQVLSPGGGGRVHVVGKGDTLYKLARDYYNNESRWRDIWQANQQRVGNPNQIPLGMKLIIP